MASDGQSVQIPAASLVHGSQAPIVKIQPVSVALPQRSTAVPAQTTAKPAVPAIPDLNTQVAVLNKYLNDSGRPDQFRVDPTSDDKVIQELNPANGEVIAQYSATEFAALARSLGISGVLVDGHA
jgi:carbamoylphosphate synthase large subunit